MLTEHEARSASIVGDIEKYEKEISEYDARAEEISETVGEYKASVEAADKEIFALDREINSKSDETERLRIELGRINSDKSALDSRIAALSRMLEHFDGYNNSVKYVMGASSRGDLAGIHGPVSHLIHVPDAYTVAVETALGAGNSGNCRGKRGKRKKRDPRPEKRFGGTRDFLSDHIREGKSTQPRA